jgi:site-specific recombinase XerD
MIFSYYLRKSKTDKHGNAPIYAKITSLGGTTFEKSTGIKSKTDLWQKNTDIQAQLSAFESSLNANKTTPLAPKCKKEIKQAINSFDLCNSLKLKSKGTIRGDKNRMKLLYQFFMQSAEYFKPSDIDNNTANRYIIYLNSLYSYKPNTLNRHNKFLKMFVKYCHSEGMVAKNKVEIVVKTQKPKLIQHLNTEEVERLRKANYCPRLEKVRDLFLFACNTGLAYCDLAKISIKHLQADNIGRKYLRVNRYKTETECIIPLSAEAMEIWQKYQGVLPTISYQKYNKYIKECAQAVNINQNVSTHTARRTCGMILLNKGMEYDLLAKILGHTDTKTTKNYYARYRNETVLDAYFKLVG